MTPVVEQPYLDESSLGRFLRERLDPETLSNARVPGITRRFQPDYRSQKHKLIVEFDGDQRALSLPDIGTLPFLHIPTFGAWLEPSERFFVGLSSCASSCHAVHGGVVVG